MSFLEPEEQERVELYRLFAFLLMNIPDIDLIEDFSQIFEFDLDESYEEISNDYIELFIDGKVPNYEGYYREIINSEIPINFELYDVQHFYWSVGVAVDEEFDLPPDHVSMELLFMEYLIEQGLKDEEIEFIRRLYEWIPLFCDTLYENAKTDFYKEVALALKDFIISEVEG